MLKVAICGYGYLGKAYHKIFSDAVIYDEPNKLCMSPKPLSGHQATTNDDIPTIIASNDEQWLQDARAEVNSCDIALIAVPTDLADDGELDMSIVEDVVSWLETPTILIKSALQPGTVDRLVEKTGKDIVVSLELIGEGTYYQPEHKYPHPRNPKKHQMIVVGGEEPARSIAAELLWSQMSPDIRIHLVTALEAEITKMAENTYGALKVTWSNVLRDICDSYGANFIQVHQAWSEDGRVDPMHTRSVSFNRGWNSKCYNKDVRAFAKLSKSNMLNGLVEDNERHLGMNNQQDMVGKRDGYKLSFDDGSIFDLKLAEILNKHGFKATLYIPVNNAKYLATKGISALTKQHILDLVKDGYTIGSHGVNHELLTRVDEDTQKREIYNSKKYWEDNGVEVNSFCYPRGYFNQDIKKKVADAGYTSARTTIVGELLPPTDPFETNTTVHIGLDRMEYGTDWLTYAKNKVLEAVKRSNNHEDIEYQAWGHSAEIEANNQWDNLEELLEYINENIHS